MAQNDFTKAHQQYIHSLKMTRLKILLANFYHCCYFCPLGNQRPLGLD